MNNEVKHKLPYEKTDFYHIIGAVDDDSRHKPINTFLQTRVNVRKEARKWMKAVNGGMDLRLPSLIKV